MRKFLSYTSKPSLLKAFLIPVEERNNRIPVSQQDQNILELGQFYLNPNTWNDSKETKWVKHLVPGMSDPHQQWVAGGPRTITFEALITRDLSFSEAKSKKNKTSIVNTSKKNSVVAGIASLVQKIGGLSDSESILQQGQREGTFLNLDITEKLNYYRSLLYPNISSSANRISSPPNLVRLVVGSTLGKRAQTARFVVDKIEIRITKQFPDLRPMEAVVAFTLTEFVDRPLSSKNDILTDV